MNDKERYDQPAEKQDQEQAEGQGDRIGLQDRVATVPDWQIPLRQAFFLVLPGASQTARDFAEGKPIDALSHPGTRRVRRC